VSLIGGVVPLFVAAVAQAVSSEEDPGWLLVGLGTCATIALVSGIGAYLTPGHRPGVIQKVDVASSNKHGGAPE